MISKHYCQLNSRLGFHFTTMESFVSSRTRENYITFSFRGGAADVERKKRRVRFVGELLSEYDYVINIDKDRLEARLEGFDKPFMESRLKVLGYLFIHTRQLDMIMTNTTMVEFYRKKFKKDMKKLTFIE